MFTMNRISKIVPILALVLAVLLIAAPTPASAQTAVVQTVLSSAVTNTANTIVVGAATVSSTQFYAGNGIYIDREYMTIQNSYTSGTTIPVTRGQNGTLSTAHASNAVVFVGPPTYFPTVDLSGSCTASLTGNVPRINVRTGNLFTCVSGLWTAMNLIGQDYLSSYRGVTGSITGLLTDSYVVYTSLSGAAPTYTLPSISGVFGKRIIIGTAVAILGTNITISPQPGQNIGPAASTSLTLSSVVVTPVRLISISNAWLTW